MTNEQLLPTETPLDEAAMKKLAGAHVAVFGLGSVGSWCAEALARAGVGTLTLADDDMVSPADLHGQVHATQSSIGQPKAIAMAVRLREINPDGKFIPKCFRYSDAGKEDFFPAEYDYIVDAIGRGPGKPDLIETAVREGIPIVSALDTGGTRDAGQFRIADISQAGGSPSVLSLREELRTRGIDRLKVVFSRETAAGTAPWASPVAGFLLAQAVILDLIQA